MHDAQPEILSALLGPIILAVAVRMNMDALLFAGYLRAALSIITAWPAQSGQVPIRRAFGYSSCSASHGKLG